MASDFPMGGEPGYDSCIVDTQQEVSEAGEPLQESIASHDSSENNGCSSQQFMQQEVEDQQLLVPQQQVFSPPATTSTDHGVMKTDGAVAAKGGAQAYANLVVVDLDVVKSDGNAEIVEISWCIYDVEQRAVIEEGSAYVRPETVQISQDRLDKMGITEEVLSSAASLGDAIERLDSVIFRKCQETRKPVMLCSFGRQQICRDLRTISKAKDVTLFAHYNHYIDIKPLAKDLYKLKGDDLVSLKQCCGALGVATQGEREEGLAACRCICALLSLMLTKGLLFKKEHTIIVDDSQADEAAQGSDGTRLRLRGLPWDVSYESIMKFLKPLISVEESDICICIGLDKRVTGEAFVSLPSSAMRDLAVRNLHGRMMGQRWIEVFKATDDDWERAGKRRLAVLNSEHVDGRDADVKELNLTVLKLRGLPWSCNEREIVSFFKEGGFDIRVEDVTLGVAPDGRMSGMAYVDLSNSSLAEQAKEKMHRRYLGKRFVEVYPSTREEMARARRPGRFGDMGGAMRSRGGRSFGSGGLNNNNGPYGSGYGMPAGGAYGISGGGSYALSSAGGAASSYMGAGGISSDSYGSSYGQAPYGSAHSTGGIGQSPDSTTWTHSVLRLRGMPFTANEQHIVHFFNGFHMAAILPSTIPIDGRPSGEAYVQFVDTSEAWRAFQAKNGGRMEKRYIELFPASKQEMNFAAQGGDPRVFRERNRVGVAAF